MLILAFETATVPGSAALARDGEVIGEIELPRDKYISEALLPAIDGLLGRAGVGPGNLDILAFAIGPGSFTGLRVGLATIKGLALVLGVPIAPVSSLCVVASAADPKCGGVLRAVIDAGRGEVFSGVFRAEAGRVEAIEEEKRIRWADFWPEVRSGEVIAGLVPESERARAKDRGALVDPVRPSAGGVARRAFDQIVRGIASPEAMDVVSIRYLKPSWAEEVLGERGAITGVVAESVKAGAGGRGITIEEMRLEDLGSVLAIEKSSFSNPWTMAQFKAELAAPHGASVPLVARNADGRLVGFLCGRIAAGEAEILDLAVEADRRRWGIGTRLLAAFLDKARSAGVSRVHLEVRALNTRAQLFYRRFGFQGVGRRTAYYLRPTEDALLLALDMTKTVASAGQIVQS